MKLFNLSNRGNRCSVPANVRALQLLVWLVVALMLPNIVLAFTEGYNGWSVAAGIILPLGLYLLTTLFTRRVSFVALVLLPVLALCAVQLVLLYLYGNSIIAVDMYTNIMTTNSVESSELLRGMTPVIIGVALLYVPLLYAVLRQIIDSRYSLSGSVRRGFVMAGALLTIVGIQLLYPASRVSNSDVVIAEIFPLNAINNLRIALHNRWAVERYAETSAEYRHEAERAVSTSKREVYIYIIGESSRACSWSLYGYQRITNPRLSAREDIYLFKNVITQSNTTHKSVPLMLSGVDIKTYEELFRRKGLASLFNEAGFHSYFISTQSPQGAMVDNLAAECDDIVYVSAPSHDMELLRVVKRVVEANDSDNILFILHCSGSHYCYNQRYTEEFAIFQPDNDSAVDPRNIEALRNAYDNSILYTDHILSSFVEYLDSLDACTAMLYCSDHGEGLFDDERGVFLHASPMVTYYQLHVPCLAWFSQEYCDSHPDKVTMARQHRWSPATTGAMFHTMADIASIRGNSVDFRRSLVNVAFDESASRLYLNDKNEAVKLNHRMGITNLDRREFLSRGVTIDD